MIYNKWRIFGFVAAAGVVIFGSMENWGRTAKAGWQKLMAKRK